MPFPPLVRNAFVQPHARLVASLKVDVSSLNMLRVLCPIVYFHLALSILFFLPIIVAQTSSCRQEKIYRDLQANIENGSDIFCDYLLKKVSLVGTLREDPTLFYYQSVTDTKSTDLVYVYRSTTTKTKITTTSFEPQQRTAITPTAPLPSYVQQYPTPRVIKAWYAPHLRSIRLGQTTD